MKRNNSRDKIPLSKFHVLGLHVGYESARQEVFFCGSAWRQISFFHVLNLNPLLLAGMSDKKFIAVLKKTGNLQSLDISSIARMLTDRGAEIIGECVQFRVLSEK